METEKSSAEGLTNLICEEWRDIQGYEGSYQVSNFGRVRSLDRVGYQRNKFDRLSKYIHKGQILKNQIQKNGYKTVDLHRNGKLKRFAVHRLVAEQFLEKSEGKNCINHLDSNPLNNNVNNLEWCTQSENIQYAYDQGRKIPPHQRLIGQYDMEGNLIRIWHSQTAPERELGICQANIYKVCRGKRQQTGGFKWAYIE